MIASLHIGSFRGIQDLELDYFGRVNVFSGKNACGKSSILHAIGYASRRVTHKSIDGYPSIQARYALNNSNHASLAEKDQVGLVIEFLSLLRGHDFGITGGMGLWEAHKQVYFYETSSGAKQLMHIASVLGDNPGGVALLDDLGQGLHYSLMDDVWRLVLSWATKLNVQVFASTHSSDAIRSFAHISHEMGLLDGEVYHLGQSILDNKTLATRYNVFRVKEILDSGRDIR